MKPHYQKLFLASSLTVLLASACAPNPSVTVGNAKNAANTANNQANSASAQQAAADAKAGKLKRNINKLLAANIQNVSYTFKKGDSSNNVAASVNVKLVYLDENKKEVDVSLSGKLAVPTAAVSSKDALEGKLASDDTSDTEHTGAIRCMDADCENAMIKLTKKSGTLAGDVMIDHLLIRTSEPDMSGFPKVDDKVLSSKNLATIQSTVANDKINAVETALTLDLVREGNSKFDLEIMYVDSSMLERNASIKGMIQKGSTLDVLYHTKADAKSDAVDATEEMVADVAYDRQTSTLTIDFPKDGDSTVEMKVVGPAPAKALQK